jgi:hypothetical protein
MTGSGSDVANFFLFHDSGSLEATHASDGHGNEIRSLFNRVLHKKWAVR